MGCPPMNRSGREAARRSAVRTIRPFVLPTAGMTGPPGAAGPPPRPDRAGERRLADRLRDGAPQEAETDDGQLVDHAVFASGRTVRKAFMSRRFSSGVPTVTRRAFSIPKLVSGRTITPSRSSRWYTSTAFRPTSTRMKLARDGVYLRLSEANSS